MRILLELSSSGVRVDQFRADNLNDQILAGRVLDTLAPDLRDFGGVVQRAFHACRGRSRPRTVIDLNGRKSRRDSSGEGAGPV